MTTMAVRYRDTRRGASGFADAWTALGGTIGQVTEQTLLDAIRSWSAGAGIVAGPQERFDGIDSALRWPTCGVSAAALVSRWTIRPWGTGLARKAAWSIPGIVRSPT